MEDTTSFQVFFLLNSDHSLLLIDDIILQMLLWNIHNDLYRGNEELVICLLANEPFIR